MKKKIPFSLLLLGAALCLTACVNSEQSDSLSKDSSDSSSLISSSLDNGSSSSDASSNLSSSTSAPLSSSSLSSPVSGSESSSPSSPASSSESPSSSSSSSAPSSSSVPVSSSSIDPIVATYYSQIDLNATGSTLRSSLGTLLNNAAYSIPSYEALKTSLPKADLDPEGSGKMLGFYDETPLPTSWDDQATWNREHVWPKSWGNLGTSGPGADPHMLRPCSVKINTGRGNSYYGLNSDGLWDPGQSLPKYRGIAARICFYMATRYWKTYKLELAENPTTNCMGKKSRLLEWNRAYPVDDTEIHRNNVLCQLYNVRNPFIDYPNLATAIWGS